MSNIARFTPPNIGSNSPFNIEEIFVHICGLLDTRSLLKLEQTSLSFKDAIRSKTWKLSQIKYMRVPAHIFVHENFQKQAFTDYHLDSTSLMDVNCGFGFKINKYITVESSCEFELRNKKAKEIEQAKETKIVLSNLEFDIRYNF